MKLLIDGIPVSDAESGLVDWRMLPAFAIDRVEALRGRGSAVYGDLRIAKRVRALTARLDVLNVTGDRYAEAGFTLQDLRGAIVPFFDPAQGVTIKATVEWSFRDRHD